MDHSELDRIRVSRWSVQVGIGAYDHEKTILQELILDVTVAGDFRAAGLSDQLEDALDYAALKESLETWMSGRRWQLLEAFGEEFCAKVLEHPQAQRVELTIDKPAAQSPALVSYTLIRNK